MRILWRTAWPTLPRDSALIRDVALVCLADAIVGVSFGATSVGGGLAWWVPVGLSVLVFAGGSQIAAVGVVLAGGSPPAAGAAGAGLETRPVPPRPAGGGGGGGRGADPPPVPLRPGGGRRPRARERRVAAPAGGDASHHR